MKVAAASAKGFECTVSPDSATIAPQNKVDFGVKCDVPETYSGDLSDELTVTVTRLNADDSVESVVTRTTNVTGEDTEYNEQVTVTDPAIGFEATYDWTGEGTTHVENLAWNASLPSGLNGCTSFNNEAILTGENGLEIKDNAVAHVCAATVSGHVFVDTTEGHTGDQLEGAVLFGGEPIQVKLLDADGNEVAATQTTNGFFEFTGVEKGTYRVQFTLTDERVAWSLQAESDSSKIIETGRTDAGVPELDTSVKVLTNEEFVVDENQSSVPNIDAAVWQIMSLTVDGGDTETTLKVNGTYGYRYDWEIEKSVDHDAAEVKAGDEHTANYTVKVTSTRSLVPGDAQAEVTINLRNGEIREAQVSLVEVTGLGECTPREQFDETNPFVVPAEQTETITVDCVVPRSQLGDVNTVDALTERLAELKATVRIEQLHVFEQPQVIEVSSEDTSVAHSADLDENNTARVTDTLVKPNGDTVDQVLAETLDGADALEGKEFTYSQKLAKTGNQPEEFVNTATVTDEDGNSKASTTTVTLTSPPDNGGGWVIPFLPWFGGNNDTPPASGTPTAGKPEVEQKRSIGQLARTGASVLGLMAAAGLLTAAGVVMIRRKRENE